MRNRPLACAVNHDIGGGWTGGSSVGCMTYGCSYQGCVVGSICKGYEYLDDDIKIRGSWPCSNCNCPKSCCSNCREKCNDFAPCIAADCKHSDCEYKKNICLNCKLYFCKCCLNCGKPFCTDPHLDPDPPGGGGGSNPLTPPESEDYNFNVVLSHDGTDVTIGDTEYNITVRLELSNQSCKLPEIYGVLVKMKRECFSEDYAVQMALFEGSKPGPYKMTRKSMNPGIWEIRAEVHYLKDDETLVKNSDWVRVEEKFPPISAFENNSSIRNYLMNTLWPQAVQYAQNKASIHEVKEYGAFVYFSNGSYYASETGSNGDYMDSHRVQLDTTGAHGKIDIYAYFSSDPKSERPVCVGTLHTHYPLTWAAKNFRSDSGPSTADLNSGIPGLVYDYVEKTIKSGDKVDLPLQITSFGTRRPTSDANKPL